MVWSWGITLCVLAVILLLVAIVLRTRSSLWPWPNKRTKDLEEKLHKTLQHRTVIQEHIAWCREQGDDNTLKTLSSQLANIEKYISSLEAELPIPNRDSFAWWFEKDGAFIIFIISIYICNIFDLDDMNLDGDNNNKRSWALWSFDEYVCGWLSVPLFLVPLSLSLSPSLLLIWVPFFHCFKFSLVFCYCCYKQNFPERKPRCDSLKWRLCI